MLIARELTVTEIILRVLVSVVLGGLIGLERGMKNRPAGLRTYMLVCVGACVVMLTNLYTYQVYQVGDPVRMGAQVISGIGFLGAGTIIVTSRNQIKGLTMGMDDFLWKYLFYPTNCREAAWSHCPQGHVIGATGLYIRAEELVKLGSIYLQGGLWEDTRILSENWVNTVLQKGYELKPQAEGHAFCKGGMRGQMLMLLPERDWVVAYQGCGDYHFVDFITAYEEKLDG